MRVERVSLIIVLLVLASSFAFSVNLIPSSVVATTHFVGGAGPDNHTSIQSAINIASEGDTVFVYSGFYQEKVTISKPLTLKGEDPLNTIIDGNRTDYVVYIASSWVNLSGFDIRRSETGSGGGSCSQGVRFP